MPGDLKGKRWRANYAHNRRAGVPGGKPGGRASECTALEGRSRLRVMGASHICLACGTDLARVRPAVEPRYGLAAVTCRGCGGVAVRLQPSMSGWRRGLRVYIALRAIVLRMAVGAALMCFSVAAVMGLEYAAEQRGRTTLDLRLLLGGDERYSEWDRFGALLLMGVWVGVQLAVGVFLTAGLAHWRPRRLPWVAWAGVLAMLLSLEPLLFPARAAMGWALGDPVRYEGPTMLAWGLRLAMGLGAMVFSLPGVPLSGVFVLAAEAGRRRRFRRRRRRQRRERGYA